MSWGWNPQNPTPIWGMSFNYEPRTWEPPVASGQNFVTVMGYHRWTRWGLGGRDFDANQVELP